jgi:exopolyphosphatase/pppGpp-phosphohydrolase
MPFPIEQSPRASAAIQNQGKLMTKQSQKPRHAPEQIHITAEALERYLDRLAQIIVDSGEGALRACAPARRRDRG